MEQTVRLAGDRANVVPSDYSDSGRPVRDTYQLLLAVADVLAVRTVGRWIK